MEKALVIGGSNGIGLSIALELSQLYKSVIVVDKVAPDVAVPRNCYFIKANLQSGDYGFLNDCNDVNALVITAGFGRVAAFENIAPVEIDN